MKKIFAMASAIVLVTVGGAAAAWATDGPTANKQPPASPRVAAASAAAVPPAGTHELQTVAISACRVVDTRRAGGPIAPGTARSFYVAGTAGFAAQGGPAAGCGVPDDAVAVSISVTALDAGGTGYFRFYPAGTALPSGTFMNFTKTFNVTTSGNIKLTTGGGKDITVSGFTVPAGLVVDVTGYSVPPIWAELQLDGSVIDGSRVTGTTHLNTGEYEVRFDRDVTHCGLSATTFYLPTGIYIEPRLDVPNGVYVRTVKSDNSSGDVAFWVSVDC
jgi:hypothetical protein